ncbi:hypothetical protein [Streptomyces yunnanensis]|uniref:hypothetical protein n=1 Tax=Streptomyces yunnanensis TaxID=156453 RepID=UPI00116144B3|nr:hypothetical protein [Streptomyces yunnanensis]
MENAPKTDEIEAVPDAKGALAWLHERLTPSTDVWEHVVTEVVPEGFSAYVRVFHAWTVEEDPGLRRTWREMAEAAGACYHGELVGGPLRQEIFTPPVGDQWETTEGEADPVTRRGLADVLMGATAPGQGTYFSYELSRTFFDEETLVWKSSLPALEAVRSQTGEEYAGPEHWWPEDRSWVVGCDWDLCSTYIACSEELADQLVRSDLVEALRVAPTARVDDGSDSINTSS